MNPSDPIGLRLRAAASSNGARPSPSAADLLPGVLERAAREGLVDVAWTTADTPIGPLLVASTDAGLVKVAFGGAEVEAAVLEELALLVAPRVVEVPARLDGVRRQLDEYFAGRRTSFELPIDWRLTGGYRRQVLQTLFSQVAFGRTVSYGELARTTGNPRASRAVGTAMATNPVPVVVPCHRVLRTGGALGGYGGGLDRKRYLLAHEGVLLGRS